MCLTTKGYSSQFISVKFVGKGLGRGAVLGRVHPLKRIRKVPKRNYTMYS